MNKKSSYRFISITLMGLAAIFTTARAAPAIDNSHVRTSSYASQHNASDMVTLVGGCQIFPQNNFWNTPVNDLPVHSLSSAWINSIGRNRGFHMDFGSGTWDGGLIGIPFNLITTPVTAKTVTFYYPDESDAGPYPIPTNPAIEYGSDHHILTINTNNCTLYEIYDASQSSGNWYAGSGAIWDLNSNTLRPNGWTSADAAGLPIFPGLARYEEILAGEITHALRFTTNCTANYYIWPARHVAQSGTCTTPVPFGARFRLKADYNISGFSPQAQIILLTMKKYGIVLADNGSPWYVTGTPNEGWNNDILHELDVVTGNNFEAVDTSSMMVNINSGEAYQRVPSPWIGSVSISSDKNVVAVGRPHIGAEITSYDGFSSGALSAYVPMLFKDAFGGSYDAALYVQNVSASSASLTIKFYDSSGTLSCTKNDTVSSLASKGYWLPSESCLPSGWVGGALITSDQNIVAIGRPHIGAEVMTYNGFSSGSTSASIPMLFKDAFGGSYDAAFYIQNIHPSNTANLTINFYDSSGALSCTKNDTLSPLASKGYWVPAESCLPTGWVGGVIVTSDQPIVSVGRPHIGSQITTYNGFSSGSTSSFIPMLFKDAFGGSYDAAFYLQNTHSSNTANLTIQFYDSAGILSCTKNDSLAPFASKGYWVPSETCLPAGWVGGAVVTSDQPIVSVGRPHIGSQITTYNGFSSGSSSSFLSMLFKDAFGGSYDSAFYIQNTEATQATVTTKFYDSSGILTCSRTDTIQPKATLGIWLPSATCYE